MVWRKSFTAEFKITVRKMYNRHLHMCNYSVLLACTSVVITWTDLTFEWEKLTFVCWSVCVETIFIMLLELNVQMICVFSLKAILLWDDFDGASLQWKMQYVAS